MLQQQLIRQRLEVGAGHPRLGLNGRSRRQIGDKRGGEFDRLRPQGGVEPPVEPRLAVQRGKQVGKGADGLRTAQKQDAAGIQAVVKERDQFFLHLRVQVDQQVAADQDVELGEGRVHDHVLRGKDHHLADLLAHPVAVLVLDEEPAQALGRDVRGDVGRKDARARLVDGVPVQVGGKDLERKVPGRLDLLQRLLEDHGQGIGLLPRGAAGRPGPQHPAFGMGRQQGRDDLVLQLLPGRRVAEKAGDADQKLLEEQLDFLGILAQKPDIGGDLVDLVQAHAPLDPAVDGALLVQGKIVAGLGPQQDQDLFQGALRFALPGGIGCRDKRGVLQIVDDPARQFLRRGDHVGQPGVDGAARHAVELGRGRRLYKDHPGLLLDGPQAQRAVGAHPRQDDADAPGLAVIGQGAEEEIDRQAQAPGRRRFEQVQHPVQDGHVFVGRDHIDAVRCDLLAVPDLDDRHGGGALEQLHHDALVGRVQVLDDDKGHAAACRHVPQKQLQRLEPPGRGADADDGERLRCSWEQRSGGAGAAGPFFRIFGPDGFFMGGILITAEEGRRSTC